MYQNLSSSSFDTTLIITVKIENVYANIFNDLKCLRWQRRRRRRQRRCKYFYSHIYTHAYSWTGDFTQQILIAAATISITIAFTATANTLDAGTVDSLMSCWLQATRFSHKALNAVRIRFAFIRSLVMWCESHKSLKSLSFHFHCSYYLALALTLSPFARASFFHQLNISWKSSNISSSFVYSWTNNKIQRQPQQQQNTNERTE